MNHNEFHPIKQRGSTIKQTGGTVAYRVPMYPLPLHVQSCPQCQHPTPDGVFVMVDELILTCQYHPKSIVYIKVHL